jgi:protein-disulfide isomerase
MHTLAFKAAEASHCAGEQGKFWEMHDSMIAGQQTLDALETHAEAIQLDLVQFQACLNADKYADAVRQDMSRASELGVNGTPSFVLAVTDPEDPSNIKGLSLVRGAQPFENFKRILDQALTNAER